MLCYVRLKQIERVSTASFYCNQMRATLSLQWKKKYINSPTQSVRLFSFCQSHPSCSLCLLTCTNVVSMLCILIVKYFFCKALCNTLLKNATRVVIIVYYITRASECALGRVILAWHHSSYTEAFKRLWTWAPPVNHPLPPLYLCSPHLPPLKPQ